MSRPDDLLVSGNVINNPPLAFMHYHLGAMHPYFPEYIEPAEEEEEEEKEMDEEDEENEEQDKASPSSLMRRQITSSWRPSDDPNWQGPDGYSWSLDNKPPRSPHRWLRLEDDDALDHTPASKLTYEVWGDSYESWAIAAQMHYSLLENIEGGDTKLDLYKFGSGSTWTMGGERIRINFMCIEADQVLDTLDDEGWTKMGDEDMLTIILPAKLHRCECSLSLLAPCLDPWLTPPPLFFFFPAHVDTVWYSRLCCGRCAGCAFPVWRSAWPGRH
jgi:hypothetical protein